MTVGRRLGAGAGPPLVGRAGRGRVRTRRPGRRPAAAHARLGGARAGGRAAVLRRHRGVARGRPARRPARARPPAAGARAVTATSGSTCWSPRARWRSGSTPRCRCGTWPRRWWWSRRPAGGSPTSAAGPPPDGGDAIATNGLLHEAALAIVGPLRSAVDFATWSGCSATTDGRPRPRRAVPEAEAPLATRMRPRTLDEFVGQEHLLAAGSALRRAIEEGHPHSMILHGPPGSGKTTLARLVASTSGAAFEEESAVQAGRAEVRAVIERARERLRGGRAADHLLPRRDPPLQQGPAGRPAAGGRGRADHADRRDHREPVLRGQLGADLAHAPVRARGAGPRRRAGAARPGGRARPLRRPRAGIARRRSSSWPSAPAATPARRSTRWSWRARRPADDEPVTLWPTPRTRSSGGRCSTTARPTGTTTRSPPGSRPPAARIPTRRCTTWR